MSTSEVQRVGLAMYVPVISRAYLEFVDSHLGVDDILVLDRSITGELRQTQKDLRAIEPSIAARLLEMEFGRQVSVVGRNELNHYAQDGNNLVLPNDDVSAWLIEELGLNRSRVVLDPIFLRWNRSNIDLNVEISPDCIVRADDLPTGILQELMHNKNESIDWWRQNSAVIFDNDGRVISTGRNHYVPGEYSGEIDGDMRSQLNRGPGQESYNTIHAEAISIAVSAKNGVKTEGMNMACTNFPCHNCAKLIAASGICRTYYLEGYAANDGVDILKSNEIEIVKVDGLNVFVDQSRTIPVAYPETI